MAQKNNKYLWIIFAIMVLSVGTSFFLDDSVGFLENRAELEAYIRSFGGAAPVILIALIIAEVIFAPLPGGFLPLITGFVFGSVLGIVYSWIGNVAGSVIAFGIARLFGERVIRFFSPQFNNSEYTQTLRSHKSLIWVLYALPIAPVDVLSFAIGASEMTFKRFFTLISTSFLVRVAILNILGDTIASLIFI